MAYEINDNSGSLFRNDENSKFPEEYSGTVKINGVEMWINAKLKDYNKKDGTKGKFFSLWFKEKAPRPQPAEPRQGSWSDELDDEVPF